MESKVNAPAHPDNTEVPAVDFSDHGPKPRYQLTPLGYDRMVRIHASLHWLMRQTSDSAVQDMFAAYLEEIDALLEQIVIMSLPDSCTADGL